MIGVIITSLSASTPQSIHSRPSSVHVYTYPIGIALLTLALLLSGFLGLLQDKTYAQHRRQLPTWQESTFYLHFLALPMFYFVRHDLLTQLDSINSSPTITLPFLVFPKAYIPFLINAFTQLLCVAGVHRLTTRVSSLTVTLVLVVRKAVSLVISVLWFRNVQERDSPLTIMWFGAALVMIGTIGYALGGNPKTKTKAKMKMN